MQKTSGPGILLSLTVVAILICGSFVVGLKFGATNARAALEEMTLQLNPTTGGNSELLFVKPAEDGVPIQLRRRQITVREQTFLLAIAKLDYEGQRPITALNHYSMFVKPGIKSGVAEQAVLK